MHKLSDRLAVVVIVWRRRDRQARQSLAANTDLAGRDFSSCRLVAMDLRNKRLSGSNLQWADLTEADLSGADLSGANLRGAYLTGTQLNGASLRGACLDDTYLLMTNFGVANLKGATFAGAIWDQGTTWPPGFTPPKTEAGRWHGTRR